MNTTNTYSPHYIYWELSNYCNLQCKHCFAEAGTDKKTIIDESLLYSAIKKITVHNFPAIRFGGGEPLMVPYLPRLVQFCTSLGVKTDITTNGTLISDHSLVQLHRAGLRELTISVDGLRDNHDFIRGPGNYERTHFSIVKALTYKYLPISVAFTVTSQNYYEIEDFVDTYILLGIKKFYFFRYCPNANADTLMLSQDQLCRAAEQIFRLSNKYPEVTIIHEGFSFYEHQWYDRKLVKEGCNFLNNVLTINYSGNVLVCAAIKKVLGNIYTDPVETIYRRVFQEQEQIKYIPDLCKTCVYCTSCHGGCKSYSYITYRNYSEKDILCYSNLIKK